MDVKTLLNLIQIPTGNLRRDDVELYDKVTIASGTTSYSLFSGSITQFVRNLQLPVSGQEIYAVTSLKMFINTLFITATDLVELLQKSYLEIVVSNRQQLKIPLFQVLNFQVASVIGATTVANFSSINVQKLKKLLYPIILGQSSTVQIKLVITSTAATDLNNVTIEMMMNAIQSTVLDPALQYDPAAGNQFQDIDYTLYNTLAISTANQTDFQCFSDNTLASNLFSQNLPLSADQRFEIQNLEILFVSPNVASQAETLNKILNNRSYNELKIVVDNTIVYKSSLAQLLNVVTEYANVAFLDNAGTPVSTNLTTFETLIQSKTLQIPVIIPATGNVNVTLSQPGSSLNNGQSFTIMLNGVLKRSKA